MILLISLVGLTLTQPIILPTRPLTCTFSQFTVKPSTGLPYSIEYQVQNTESLLYDKPVMPRKMKRHSTRSKNGPYQPGYYQNPIRSILDRPLDTSSNDSCGIFYSGQPNPAYTKSGSRPSSERNLLRPESLLPNDRPRHSYPNQSETNI